jgi:hypothetical protein
VHREDPGPSSAHFGGDTSCLIDLRLFAHRLLAIEPPPLPLVLTSPPPSPPIDIPRPQLPIPVTIPVLPARKVTPFTFPSPPNYRLVRQIFPEESVSTPTPNPVQASETNRPIAQISIDRIRWEGNPEIERNWQIYKKRLRKGRLPHGEPQPPFLTASGQPVAT